MKKKINYFILKIAPFVPDSFGEYRRNWLEQVGYTLSRADFVIYALGKKKKNKK